MTNEQRERIAREVMGWDKPEDARQYFDGAKWCFHDTDDPRWLYPAMEALMLRGWVFRPTRNPSGKWLYWKDGFQRVADTLADAINAALLKEVGE